MHNKTSEQAPLRVLIIGSGFAGLGLAMHLRKQGHDDFLILEKSAEAGGTWRDNHYPGAACDVPSHLYSFSFEPKLDWSRCFAGQAEILAYVRQCIERYRLAENIRCNSEVIEARFDETRALWRVRTTGGPCYWAKSLVSACGQLNRPLYPKIVGLERFAGPQLHSAAWSHGVDLHGKRVAVIGSGASAIQFIPQLAKQVGSLTVFQRTASYVLPKPDRAYQAWELALMQRWPWLQKVDRLRQYCLHEVRALAFVVMPSLMLLYRRYFLWHLRRQVADPSLRAKLTPDYLPGCKRILLSNDFYPALAQPQVELVTEGIREITADALITADGREYPADVLVFGTGFAATEFLAPMSIYGRAGVELNQRWREGAEAYKGISVSGFPNLFILYGPNTNLGHSSIIYMLESQFSYVLDCLHQLDQGLRYVDVRPEVEQRWNRRLQDDLSRTVWEQGCSSWYKNALGKQANNWPGFTFTYRQQTRRVIWSDYEQVR